MQKVKLKFRNRSIDLECDNPEMIERLAQKFNDRMSALGDVAKIADAKAALIAGINMEYEIENLKADLDRFKNNQQSEDFAEALEHLSIYINGLNNKLRDITKS